jgi:hypothetical protein
MKFEKKVLSKIDQKYVWNEGKNEVTDFCFSTSYTWICGNG